MSTPIKIIFRVKNDNQKTQYHIYIYVGKIPSVVNKVLEKIKELSLQDALLTLNNNEIKELSNFYGEKWYTYFFNKYHIGYTIKNILTNKQTYDDILKKYGEQWAKNNINEKFYTPQLYSYGSIIKRNLIHHEMRTHKGFEYVPSKNVEYSTTKKMTEKMLSSTSLISETSDFGVKILKGGDDDTEDISDETPIEETTDEVDQVETEELEDGFVEDEAMSKKDLDKTKLLLDKVMESENILKKKETKMIDFDTSKDTNIYRENLADIFTKNYIHEQYIFEDDSIKVIKNKICCSIRNHPKFGKKNFIIPSRQYIWSEYVFENHYEKVMIGLKWTQRNELLNIDIEPSDNIKIYSELRDNIKNLKNDLKRFNSRIKKEDDDDNILL